MEITVVKSLDETESIPLLTEKFRPTACVTTSYTNTF